MIIDSSKLPMNADLSAIRQAVRRNSLQGIENSIYIDAKVISTKTGNFAFILDTDKFFERVKGQEGKYYDQISRMKRIMEYASTFN